MNAELEFMAVEDVTSAAGRNFPVLEYHELADLFSRMNEEQFERLVNDVRLNGLLEPIVLYEGKILDGRHRYEACRSANKELRFVTYLGKDALQFVRSLNVHRRHLSETQAAAAVALQQDWAKAAKHGGSRKEGTGIATSADRARQAQVSASTQKKVDAVGRANPELLGKLVRGEMTLSQARAAAGLKGRSGKCGCDACVAHAAKVKELETHRLPCESKVA